MVRTIFGLLLVVTLVGCASNPVKKETETQQVNKPILYCPAPQQIERPTLPTDTIEQDDEDGEVVKKYKATVKLLLEYSKQLKSQLNRYDKTNEAYEQLRQEFLRQREQEGFPVQRDDGEQ